MKSSTTRRLDAAEALLDHPENSADSEFAHSAFVAIHDALRWAFEWRTHEEDWNSGDWANTERVRHLLTLARQMDALLDPEPGEIEEDQRLLAVAVVREQTSMGEQLDLQDVARELGINLDD